MTRSRKITDFDIQALVDGEVDDLTRHFLMDAIKRDIALQNRYALYMKQKELLKLWWKDN